jgi:hypothetical protein
MTRSPTAQELAGRLNPLTRWHVTGHRRTAVPGHHAAACRHCTQILRSFTVSSPAA